jgi:hypothetical protein
MLGCSTHQQPKVKNTAQRFVSNIASAFISALMSTLIHCVAKIRAKDAHKEEN